MFTSAASTMSPSFAVRRFERGTLRRMLKVPCVVVRERDFRPIASSTTDISPDGMQVLSEADVRVGEPLLVTFQATRQGLWFDTDATVVRICHGLRDEDRGRSLGIRFDSLDSIERLILRGAWRKIPPPLPRRTARIDYAGTVMKIARGEDTLH